MTSQNPDQHQQSKSTSASEDKTFDVRDLVSKPDYEKDPREVIENPAVTPQMLDESDDSQSGME
ncbi:hypothetical protein [Leptolyngbya iicbica]|uniref:Uncharacterized protein n=2 Tax=Cyanophyceae TaxID=3028117 RepID=A0A4V2E2I9_9CYAN|nr:hypothetical protein [Leptolyngbya sp. LK]RZM78716.1 hypothetical protein DYY88_07900 [Leptolyngbya sp. LK]